ncbi:hypothetical protein CIB48_g4663 [Xylaria polymorpha]|nr:hypothetical protein CIB48_g4663 [Xylaria polymorpha]
MIEASRQLTNRQCGLPLQKKKKNRQQNAFNPKPEGTLIAGMARTHEALVMQVDESGDDEKGKWHGKKNHNAWMGSLACQCSPGYPAMGATNKLAKPSLARVAGNAEARERTTS